MSKVIPLGDRILARLLPAPDRSGSGRVVLLTDRDAKSVRFAPKRFVVLAPEQGRQNPSTGEWFRTTDLEAGDVIVTGMYPGDSYQNEEFGEIWFIKVENATYQEMEEEQDFSLVHAGHDEQYVVPGKVRLVPKKEKTQ